MQSTLKNTALSLKENKGIVQKVSSFILPFNDAEVAIRNTSVLWL